MLRLDWAAIGHCRKPWTEGELFDLDRTSDGAVRAALPAPSDPAVDAKRFVAEPDVHPGPTGAWAAVLRVQVAVTPVATKVVYDRSQVVGGPVSEGGRYPTGGCISAFWCAGWREGTPSRAPLKGLFGEIRGEPPPTPPPPPPQHKHGSRGDVSLLRRNLAAVVNPPHPHPSGGGGIRGAATPRLAFLGGRDRPHRGHHRPRKRDRRAHSSGGGEVRIRTARRGCAASPSVLHAPTRLAPRQFCEPPLTRPFCVNF